MVYEEFNEGNNGDFGLDDYENIGIVKGQNGEVTNVNIVKQHLNKKTTIGVTKYTSIRLDKFRTLLKIKGYNILSNNDAIDRLLSFFYKKSEIKEDKIDE